MKLRNKKTGEKVLVDFTAEVVSPLECIGELCPRRYITFSSIKKLNEEWEDYNPPEPLIKDEKIRKAVRAWWETIPNEITDKRIIYKKNQDLAVGVYSIYCGAIYPQSLKVGKMYTITELCGVEDD